MRSRKISVAKGYDARDYALNCFGGAGGQHACLVADALGMTTVFIHPLSGLLSAYGMKLAALRACGRARRHGARREAICYARGHCPKTCARKREGGIARAGRANRSKRTARVHIRYDGSDTTLPIALASRTKWPTPSPAIMPASSASASKAAR